MGEKVASLHELATYQDATGEVQGWSPGAVRRNTEFLMCVREDKLTGVGLALTLTVRDCPATAQEWQRMRRAWEKRMKRAGMIRVHWVTEWQRRGVPHLHCAIWFSGTVYDFSLCIDAWLAVASSCGAALRGQHGRIIDGVVGWFQYVSKHAARGVRHYQRCSENLPEGWKGLTGRVWGKVGEWPLYPEVRIDLQDHRQDGDGGSSPIAVWCAPGASQTLVGSVTVIASVVLVGCSPVAIRRVLVSLGLWSGFPMRFRWPFARIYVPVVTPSSAR